jgi:hypothetical protein
MYGNQTRHYAKWLVTAPVGVEVHGTILRRAGDALIKKDYDSVEIVVEGMGYSRWHPVGGGLWECVGRCNVDGAVKDAPTAGEEATR